MRVTTSSGPWPVLLPWDMLPVTGGPDKAGSGVRGLPSADSGCESACIYWNDRCSAAHYFNCLLGWFFNLSGVNKPQHCPVWFFSFQWYCCSSWDQSLGWRHREMLGVSFSIMCWPSSPFWVAVVGPRPVDPPIPTHLIACWLMTCVRGVCYITYGYKCTRTCTCKHKLFTHCQPSIWVWIKVASSL